MRKCDVCGEMCYDQIYPEIVFDGVTELGDSIVICENCSIGYEEAQDEFGDWYIREIENE